MLASLASYTPWKGRHLVVERLAGSYANKVRVSAKEMKNWNTRLVRSATLSKYDINITPKKPRGR